MSSRYDKSPGLKVTAEERLAAVTTAARILRASEEPVTLEMLARRAARITNEEYGTLAAFISKRSSEEKIGFGLRRTRRR
jgi:hypothetical protein